MPISARPDPARRLSRVRCAGAAILSLASVCTQAGDFSVGTGAGVVRGKTNFVDADACDHCSTHAKLFVRLQGQDAVGFADVSDLVEMSVAETKRPTCARSAALTTPRVRVTSVGSANPRLGEFICE